MPDIVLVFGGSGFIGTHCIRRLRREGHQIISVDLLPPRERLEGVDYRTGDVRSLGSLNVPSGIRTIYNFAAVHTTPGHPDHEYYDTNVGGALEVTLFADRYEVSEIIFTSSISVYGPGEESKVENSELRPVSAYGKSKRIAEQIHYSWLLSRPNRRLITVRPAVVFGAGEGGNFTRMAALLRKGIFVFPGRRDTIKACIHVDDLLDSIALARTEDTDHVLFNAAYPHRYTVEQIVEAFRRDHFPHARLIDVPLGLVVASARMLGTMDILKMGVHPERVLKLVRSTDVIPGWLISKGCTFPSALELALQRWSSETAGRFE